MTSMPSRSTVSRSTPSRWLLAVAVVLALVSAGCSHRRATVLPDADDHGPPIVYVAVGASETVGVGADDPLRQAWTQVFYETALPKRTQFVNLGIPGATVAEAISKELPQALTLAPTIVTVWLNVNDLTGLVTPDLYERQLDDLVHQLRRGGTTRVLVANMPPLDRLPAYLACLSNAPAGSPPCAIGGLGRALLPGAALVNAAVATYNDAIGRVVTKEGAVLVDLHAVGLAARAAGQEASLVGQDGFHPSTAGHAAVAKAFADALKGAGGLS
jgi:lysophospholipase L1-like esterase